MPQPPKGEGSELTRFTRHVLIPAAAPLQFLAIAPTPLDGLGCPTRGLVALSAILISGLSPLGAAMDETKGRI